MLKNLDILGIKVILNKIETDRSFSISVMVNTGSKHEKENEKGISHLLEHMMFTGTNTRSAYEITESLDFYGATYNAYTSKDITNYYITSLTIKQKEVLEIFFDMITDPIFSEKELLKEKEIIFEEIKMSKDDTQSVVHDEMMENMFKGNIKYNIIADEESLKKITRDDLINYYKARYTRDNIIIAISGNYDEELLLSQIKEYFIKLNEKKVDINFEKNELILQNKEISKNINQVNIFMLCNAWDISKNLKNYCKEIILNGILGDGFSSRLFQEIREKRSLAYSVYSYDYKLDDKKVLAIYIGTSKEKYKEAIEVTKELIEKLKKDGVSEREVEKMQNTILSNRLAVKSNTSINLRYLSTYRLFNEIVDDYKLEETILSIKAEEINEIAKDIFNSYSICVVGALENE